MVKTNTKTKRQTTVHNTLHRRFSNMSPTKDSETPAGYHTEQNLVVVP